MNKYICIHGHFYQPPRDNPWTNEIEPQETAAPFANWNERITAQCYNVNAHAEILDENGHAKALINNYAKMSFNFGPTLLSWLERHEPETYRAILEADRLSQRCFSGHGSAIAQGYNHMILPLANAEDKRTQVIWGLREFEYRFKRLSEGLWLPETAVDMATLEILAALDVKYTILSPQQIEKIKYADSDHWLAVTQESIDTTRPYNCRLPSGKSIAIFIYNGYIANDVAFGHLLDEPEDFTLRILSEFNQEAGRPRLVHFATDGETYGHHQKKGAWTLASFFSFIDEHKPAQLTNYGEYLEKHPPVDDVMIKEKSSWSCAHGVERWRADCGCSISANELWNQKWREKLRAALDQLRKRIDKIYLDEVTPFINDPWKIRNDYIDFILKPDESAFQNYLKSESRKEIMDDQLKKIWHLLNMQRFAMLMYTSCGWFFDDISGLEVKQILQYAAQAIEIAEKISGKNLEEQFLKDLEKAKSNKTAVGNGRNVYAAFVMPLKNGVVGS